jgi:hypothetical protein
LPHLPSPDGYSCSAERFDGDSLYKARMAVLMMRCGIRMKYIRAALAEPVAPQGRGLLPRVGTHRRRPRGPAEVTSDAKPLHRVIVAEMIVMVLIGDAALI